MEATGDGGQLSLIALAQKGHGKMHPVAFPYHTIFEVSSQSVAIVGISGADITLYLARCEMEEEKNEVAVFNGVEMRISSLDDIWLSQKQIAQMFNKDVRTINGHVETVKKELANWEGLNSTIRKNRIVQIEGKRIENRERGSEVTSRRGRDGDFRTGDEERLPQSVRA